MAEPIRVGIVGASVARGSWGTRAHIPAIEALPEVELKAVCTAHADTAAEAARTYGAELAFHDYHELVDHPDVDLVAVCVRVPYHHEIVMAALRAGKPVYCEWPLGANLAEAEEMAATARAASILTTVGLQGRGDPALSYVRELIAGGYVGEVLTCHMTLISAGVIERPADRVWSADVTKGVNTLTIAGGHSIDALCYCLSEFAEVSAKVATAVPQWRVAETGQMVDVTAPDNVLLNGVFESGALASVHVAAVPHHGGGGWRLDIYGRDGSLAVSAGGMPQMGPNRLLGAKAGEPLSDLEVPDRFTTVPEGTPKGPPYNVAQLYTRFADALRDTGATAADFDLAVQRHRLLDAIQRSSDEGRSMRLS